MKIHEKIIVLSLIILFGNGVIGYRVYRSNEKIGDSENWVRHTEEVISETDNISLLTKNMEIGLLSAETNKQYTEPVQTSGMVFKHIARIRELTINNPAQQVRIDTLESNIHHYLDCSLSYVKMDKTKLTESVSADFHNTCLSYIKKITLLLKNIKAEESVLLLQRRQTNEYSLTVIKQFTIIMFVFMTLFIILLLIATSKYLGRIEVRQNREKELLIINRRFFEMNAEKEKRERELVIANQVLAIENCEKEKRAAELVIANTELAFQNAEKEKRASELIIANTELAFQNAEKEKRASELVTANTELAFQNSEKENRATELMIANQELAFQNSEKEKRAAELSIANTELANENCEKEKRAIELTMANQYLKVAEEHQLQHITGLEEMMFMTSHRVRQPVSNILGLSALLRDCDCVSEQDQLIDGLEKSASILDTFTRELTNLLNSLQQIGRD